MAAAIAVLPCTTACSPYTMTLPGADTMKAGAIGDDDLRAMAFCDLGDDEETPLERGCMEGEVVVVVEVVVFVVVEGVEAPPSELSSGWLSSPFNAGLGRNAKSAWS